MLQHFHSMSGPGLGSGLGPQGLPQQAGQQRSPQSQIQQHVIRMIQQQQVPQGWQSMVGVNQRAINAYQLITSLRLVKPDMDIQQSISVAMTYEQKHFIESPDRNTYDQAIHQKLSDIQETRSKQANMLQNMQNPQPQHTNMPQQQMHPQGMARGQNQAQFQINPNANPQLQQPMQVSAIPMQQQMTHQPPQLQVAMLNPNISQTPPNVHPQIPQGHGQTSFTPEELQMINRIATNMALATPPEQLEVIRHNLQNMNHGQRQALSMQNIDPVTFFFRNQAIRRFVDQRAKAAAQRANAGMLGPGNNFMPQQPRPMSQNSMAIQAQQHGPLATPQMMESSFIGNVDQIRGRQKAALRSQEAGQVVVPASNSQAVSDQQRGSIRGTPQPPTNARLGGNEAMQNPIQGSQQPSQYWGNQSLQQPNISQAAHIQVQSQAQNFGNLVTQAPLHGQAGGFGNHAGRIPQQSPAMPNLNKGLKPSPQPQAAWAGSRSAQPSQPKDQNGANASQLVSQPGATANEAPDSVQQRHMAMLNSLPPQLRQRLQQMPEEARNDLIKNLIAHNHQRATAAAQHKNSQPSEPASTQGQPTQRGQQIPPTAQQPLQNGPSNTASSNPASTQQSTVSQQQPSANISRLGNTQPQRSQTQQQQAQTAQAAQQANITLTEEQAKKMDGLNFPTGILKTDSPLSKLPQDIKTWGQLKSWVTQNDHTLPPRSLVKLRGLQGLHYRDLKQRGQQMNQNMSSNPQTPTPVRATALAPTAPMVPTRSNSQVLPVAKGVNVPQSSRLNVVQSLPQPTPQEIQAARARLPENLKGLSDEDIASKVLRQRQNDLIRPPQVPPTKPQQMQIANLQRASYQQSLQQPGLQKQIPNIDNQPNPVQQPLSGQRPQPQQTPRPPPPSKDQASKQPNPPRNTSQTLGQNQPNVKGVKRNISDDVVEVPNPNTVKREPQPQPSRTSQAPKSALNPVDQVAASQDSKSAADSQRRMQTNSKPQAPSLHNPVQDLPTKNLSDQDRRVEESARRELRLHQLMKETSQSTPIRGPVMMSQEVRATMVQKLGEAKELVQRMEQFLPIFFKMYGDEQTTRTLIQTRLMLVHQYRDADFNPKDQFTITPDELDNCIRELTKYFYHIMSMAARGSSAPSSQVATQQPSRQQLSETTTQAAPETAPSLSAANLQEHEKAMQVARQAIVQKNHNSHSGNRAPAAPTSPQPPFKLGAQSPQGVATYATRPNELTQDRLTLPSHKKRKINQTPDTTPAPARPSVMAPAKSPSQGTKVIVPDAQRASAAPILLKCQVANCQLKNIGFASQGELDQHILEVHEQKEPLIEDPLQWALEQVRIGLGLDENGKSKVQKSEVKIVAENHEAQKMKKSASMQGLKQESTTPMTRVPTQVGPSPASNLLKTPQASSNVKTPLSEAKSSAKDNNIDNPKLLNESSKETSISPDPWAGSLISPSVITATWSGITDLQFSESWSTIQNTLTPASTLPSNKSEKNSPRISDISENDAVKISLTVDDDWMPAEWFEEGLHGDMESLTVNQELLGMDWETAFGQDEGKSSENSTTGKTAQASVDELLPSAEWTRVYSQAK